MEEKRLGFWTVLALAFGSIIGTAIFTGAALGANFSGNMVIVAWIILSVLALYIAACFAELVSMFPKNGGVYEYGKQAYGRFISFMMGWLAWLVGTISAALLIVTGIQFVLPKSSVLVEIAVSIIIVILLNLIAFVGLEMSSYMLLGFAAVMITVVMAMIIKGATIMNPANLTPLFTHGIGSIFVTVFFIIESYFGWEAATYLAEETSSPKKTIPRALLIGTGTVAVLGLLLMIVMLGIIPAQELAGLCRPNSATCDPITPLAGMMFGGFGIAIIAGIALTLIGSAASSIITLPRLLGAMARDKLMLGQLKQIHPWFGTPHKAILFQSAVLIMVLMIGFAQYQVLLGILVPLALFMYMLSIMTVTVLRHNRPDIERSFKVPFGEVLPAIISLGLGSVIAIWIMSVEGSTALLLIGTSLLLFGIPLYFLIEMYYDPKMITSVNDFFSYLTLATEHITFPRGIRQEILKFLGDVKGNTILEFGCSVGTLTIPLSKEVGANGKIYATHFSEHDLKIVRRRLINKKWESERRIYGQVKLIYDFDHFVRLHPEVKYADHAVSAGMLSYMQNPVKILKEISSVLPAGAKVCFVEYADFFHVIPNKEWLSDEKRIMQVFREAGLSVQVEKKKGLFWNYIFIYGLKLGKGVEYI